MALWAYRKNLVEALINRDVCICVTIHDSMELAEAFEWTSLTRDVPRNLWRNDAKGQGSSGMPLGQRDRRLRGGEWHAFDAVEHRQGHRADFGRRDLVGWPSLPACRVNGAASVAGIGGSIRAGE